MRRPMVFVLLAGLAAMLASVMVYSALKRREAEVQNAMSHNVEVVVAAYDLPLGTKVDLGEVKLARTEMAESLGKLGVPQWPSQANFILVKIGPKHAEFVQAMQRRGILTRDRSKDQGCNGCVRLTVGTREQMRQAVTAMAEALNEIGWEKA